MTTIPSQTRPSLRASNQEHASAPASTMVASQFAPVVTASFTVDPEKDEMQANTSAGSIVATMPLGAQCHPGKPYTFRKKHASNSFTVAFTGGELYEGASTIVLTEDNATASIMYDPIASEWVRATPVGAGAGVGTSAAIDFSNVTPATGRTALGVPATTATDLKADVHNILIRECDLIDTATGTTYSFCPNYAGTLTHASIVLDGVTTAVDAASVAIDIDGTPVVLAAPLSAPALSAAGFKVNTTVSSAGAFTANQVIKLTTTSANTAATRGTVSLGGTRA